MASSGDAVGPGSKVISITDEHGLEAGRIYTVGEVFGPDTYEPCLGCGDTEARGVILQGLPAPFCLWAYCLDCDVRPVGGSAMDLLATAKAIRKTKETA